MEVKRKIAKVVNKVSFKEAEEADDKFWANATAEMRLDELIELRQMTYGNSMNRIAKVIRRTNFQGKNL